MVAGSVCSPVRDCRLLSLERAAVQGKILPVPSARIHKRGVQKKRFDNAEYPTL